MQKRAMRRVGGIPSRAIIAQVREAFKCARCDKSTIVANTAGHRQAFTGERVTPATHCTCPGGPAACNICGGYGKIDDPSVPLTDPFTPPLMDCPHPHCTARTGGAA